MKYRIERAGVIYELELEPAERGWLVRSPDGSATLIGLETRADGSRRAFTPWGELELQSARRGGELWVDVSGRRLQARVERVRPSVQRGSLSDAIGELHAPMAGKLLRVDARVGDAVRAGQALAVIEAMKMENELLSPIAGVVSQVALKAPCAIEKGALILKVEAA